MSYKTRLKELMDAKGVGRTELASAIGISYQGVRKVFDSDGAFGSKNNLKAAEYFGVNPNWLATGEGDRNAKNYQLTALPGHYERHELSNRTNQAMELAKLFDQIPESNVLGRAKAYAQASQAILDQVQPSTVQVTQGSEKLTA